ncbi:FCD domain-containing protein [Pauljensenia sp. UMB6358]|uniref:FadR/GntR family transcriptional regulator n=1 Tax=Pauljensenia sp. UMB6358 TaxID=3046335 RepID=UPI0025507F23|nr:FCD domain-containing protein [Pauljensenia sp. UMB6358]MDK7123061.1 FCD domain-containing protein [Pauljensenia sp. UMB6358]
MSPSLHSDVFEALGRRIAAGDLPIGGALTLEWIQTEFGVSRSIARECVKSLESMGLIESRRRAGILIRPASEWDALSPTLIRWQLDADPRGPKLGALNEMRAAIEPVAAAAAARRATESERTRILELAARLRAEGAKDDLTDFLATDIKLHSAILAASHNDTFYALRELVAEVLAGRTRLGLYPAHPEPIALDLHDEVARAIATGSSEAAEDAMRALVAEVREALLEKGLRGFLTTD